MDTEFGTPREVFETILERTTDPVATLPTADLTRDFIDAVDAQDEEIDARILVPDETFDDLGWSTKARVIDLRADATLGVRYGPATDVVIAGRETAATIDCGSRQPLAFLGDAAVRGQYHDRWSRGERVEFDTVGRAELLEEAEATVGPEVAEAVTTEMDRDYARGCGESPDPIKLLLWGTAVAGGRVVDVREMVRSLDMGSRERVERRLTELQDAGLLVTPPARDGTRGRPERLLVVDVKIDDPMRPPDWVRSAFS